MSWFRAVTLFFVACSAPTVAAYNYDHDFDAADQSTWPVIAIIIDDIGNRLRDGRRAVALPGPIAYAVLPHTPYAAELAQAAHDLDKEIMLHQPLQATDNNHLLGDGAVTLEHTRSDVHDMLVDNLSTVPFVVGVNNHMGSLLTRHPGHMRWLMQAISQQEPLFFVDSVTSGRSVAYDMAKELGVPSLRRDVFLDSVQTEEAVAIQFSRLKKHAREHGFAVGIGHPFSETLHVLEKELPRLQGLGYRLVGIKSMIDLKNQAQHNSPPSGGTTEHNVTRRRSSILKE